MNTTRNESTNETCPRHIWMHEVILAAIRNGADADLCRECPYLSLWYNSGEPIWMATDGLAFWAKENATHRRAERAGDRIAIRNARRA